MWSVNFLLPIDGLAILTSEFEKVESTLKSKQRTFGGESNLACNSLMRLLEPLTRKIPATSVAGKERVRCDDYGNGDNNHFL